MGNMLLTALCLIPAIESIGYLSDVLWVASDQE